MNEDRDRDTPDADVSFGAKVVGVIILLVVLGLLIQYNF